MKIDIPTGIAVGYGIFDSTLDKDFADTEKRADMQMYENKISIKRAQTEQVEA